MPLKNKFCNLKILFCHIKTSYKYIAFEIANHFLPLKVVFKIELFKYEKPLNKLFCDCDTSSIPI